MRPYDTQKWFLLQNKAIEVLVREGFTGFSMQKLAREAGLSVGSIYTYYQDKDELLLRCFGHAVGMETGAALRLFRPDMGLEKCYN
ncbi:TetR/AcrR family transcriptional regulator [Dinghuibacter silviterrae]|uniref:TetR family transcriptional regulator n=1 Tax=Dinghuibacter silviterrae TaxID=1539049 RepID=A0A4R8DTU1_9BACT|nr:helix-turn-helix domain-containing protein [Dinghuibacter silviterrae]TDX01740.1 TetR family transcriptional regulator [Dinghuibacter silviterrae]